MVLIHHPPAKTITPGPIAVLLAPLDRIVQITIACPGANSCYERDGLRAIHPPKWSSVTGVAFSSTKLFVQVFIFLLCRRVL